MKTIYNSMICLLIVLIVACNSSKTNAPDNRISIGTIDTVYSKILNEKRSIWVYVPNNGNGFYASKKYPVVYLLDGDAHFYSVMAIIQQLSEVNMNMVLPQMILVGIQNTDRTRDLTPSHVSSEPDVPDSTFLTTSGGSENFTSFIGKELIPYIESKYSADPYRILIGHSWGGLFCVNTLLNHTELFNGYIAIDPSLTWDNNSVLKQAEKLLSQKDFKGTSFFLSIANQGYSDTETSKGNTSAFEFSKYLDSNKNNNLRYSWRYYKDDNHGSVPLISEYDGLRFLFDFYNPKMPYDKFRDPSYNVDSFVVSHFDRVSRNMGYTVHPPESFMNWLGYLFIMEKQYDKAHTLLKKNVDNYPTSPNVYDSMGEILLIEGDTTAAIDNYEKSLKLNPGNENANSLIRRLKK
jgi:uncharacterized protein